MIASFICLFITFYCFYYSLSRDTVWCKNQASGEVCLEFLPPTEVSGCSPSGLAAFPNPRIRWPEEYPLSIYKWIYLKVFKECWFKKFLSRQWKVPLWRNYEQSKCYKCKSSIFTNVLFFSIYELLEFFCNLLYQLMHMSLVCLSQPRDHPHA